MKNIILKSKKDPLGFLTRALYKTTIGRLKYGSGADYDAARYWRDRFSKYHLSLQGAGDEGLSEEDNWRMYGQARDVFTKLCQQENINFQLANVLEIGCGTGFYTQLLYDLAVNSYLGVDITDVLFTDLKNKFPDFTFIKKDVTVDKLEGQFNLIVMIDVIEHIVEKTKLSFALENIRNCLSNDGRFIVAPVASESKKHLFYVHSWSLADLKPNFTEYSFRELVPFRNDYILVIKKQ
jgi:SAM-dependent methyltransferase